MSTGHIFHPGYQYLYELEAGFYTPLRYNLDWQIEDVRYLPQNVGIMFFNTPVWNPLEVPAALGGGRKLCLEPGAVRGLFDPSCPLVLPRDAGMSILLTSPAYLLGLPALAWGLGRSRLVTGAALAVVIVAVVNLMHFSQGWVQFGYRFSLDFAPFAILIVALGLERVAARSDRGRPLAWAVVAIAVALVAVSVARQPVGRRLGQRARMVTRTSAPGRGLAAAWVAAIAVGLFSLGLSLWRLMPGLGFWDTAEFQMVLPVMGTAHPTGYPTYVLIGWFANLLLSPLGEPALRMNVLSAILVAIGVAVTVDLARRLAGSLVFGMAAGIGLALTPIVWAIGTHADPHALHLTLIAIILWLLVRWEQAHRGDAFDQAPLAAEPGSDAADHGDADTDSAGRRASSRRADRLLLAAAIAVGLSVGNHSLTLLLGPGIILYLLAIEPGIFQRRRFVLANIAAFAIPTILVRFEMILRAGWFRAPFVYADPSTWTGFWYVTLGAQFHGWVTDPFGNIPGRLSDLAAMAASQLGPLAAVLVVAAVVTAVRRPRYALLTGTTMVLTLFFNSVYPDGAIDRYYLGPALIAWTWLAILGATVVDTFIGIGPVRRIRSGITAAWRPADAWPILRPIGLLGVALLLIAPSLLAIPARAASGTIDRTEDRAAQTWTRDLLAALEPNAVVVSWWSYSTPLWYVTIVDGLRPDILIVDDRNREDQNLLELSQVIDLYIGTRPVYLIRNGTSELPALVGRYEVRPIAAATASNVLQVFPIGAAGR